MTIHLSVLSASYVTVDFLQNLPENSNRSYQALYTANEIVNMVVIDDRMIYQKYVSHDFHSLLWSYWYGD